MTDYEVGYRKPPSWMQYEKGRSGNYKGRPKLLPPSDMDIIRQFFNQPVQYPFGKKVKWIPRSEAWIRNYGAGALKGSVDDATAILDILAQMDKGGDVDQVIVWMTEQDLRV